MKRIVIKILILSLLIGSPALAQTLNLFRLSDLEEAKSAYLENGKYEKEINSLISLADEAMKVKFYSITKYKAPKAEGATINDYISDSPYWWPVEDEPDAPYIRKDGERNPDRFMDHKAEVAKFYKGVFALVFASYFTGNTEYAEKANSLLKVWFIDEATKMNPNFKFSQLIRNRTKLRGVGIIDGRRFATLTEAIILLHQSGQLNNEVFKGIKNWYSELLTWLTTSYQGLDEKDRGNNHGTWWSFQVAAASNLLQDMKQMEMLDSYSKHYLLDNQIDENARQPMEEERTRSLSYSAFNVTAHTYLNSVLLKNKIDNWNYVNENNATLINVVEYLLPFVQEPSSWEIEQIAQMNNSDPLFLGFAGLHIDNKKYLEIYNELSRFDESSLNKPTFDPIQIVLDLVVKLNLGKNEN